MHHTKFHHCRLFSWILWLRGHVAPHHVMLNKLAKRSCGIGLIFICIILSFLLITKLSFFLNFEIKRTEADTTVYICLHTVSLYRFFYKQPHFRVEPRVAIKIPKMRLKVAMKLLSIFGIEAQGC